MKKGLLFLSLMMCFTLINAQNIKKFQSRNVEAKSGQKAIVNSDHLPTTFKAVKDIKSPISTGYARITLTAGDLWGDGTGYQLLLDADATAYGVEIPSSGNLCDISEESIANLPNIYSAFEYKIPTNADGILTTTNIVVNNSISIDVPAGTYDYVVTNPTPNQVMYIAGNGRYDNYNFVEGSEYIFTVTRAGEGDNIFIQVNTPQTRINWNFNNRVMPSGFTIYNDTNTPSPNIANIFTDGWVIYTLDNVNYFAAACSWFTKDNPADRWMITSQIDLTTNNSLQFDIESKDPLYLETMAVKMSTTTKEKSAFTTTLWSDNAVPGVLTNHVIDLSAYNNQKVYIAFVLTSTDMFYGIVDDIKILDPSMQVNDSVTSNLINIYPNPANDFITISNADGAEIRITDMLGKTLITRIIQTTNETIFIKELQAGTYTIQLIKDGNVFVRKLSKK